MNSSEQSPTALLICQDLFFTSKVTGTAAGLGLRVDVVGDIQLALSRLATEPYRGILVDLSIPGLSISDLIDQLPAEDRPPVIAFGAHVQADLLHAARKAGCDDALPRSKFSASLPELLSQWLNE